MNYLFPFLLLIYACTPPHRPLPPPPPPLAGEIVFRNVNVVPMTADTVLAQQDVVARGGIITAMGSSGSLAWSDSALVIDATGKYLLPGLAEMHAHVPPENDLDPMQEVLLLFALNGVTTIRGMLGHPRHLELRTKISNGEIFGPRLYTAGPAIAGDDIQTPEKARSEVLAQKEAGYDFLKILMPALSKEAFDAVVATAHEVKIPFAGHVPGTVGVRGAIEAGYATIDHLDGFVESLVPGIENMNWDDVGLFGMFVANQADTTGIPALVQRLHEQQIWVVPTQCLAERWFAPGDVSDAFMGAPEMVYMDADELKEWSDMREQIVHSARYDSAELEVFRRIRKQLVYECNRNGVGLLLGSDAPQVFNVPGFSAHHELQYLVDAGLTPYEALRSGTANVGRFWARADLGLVKTGAVSDLILLSGNPLKDISNTRRIEGVLLGNRWMSGVFIAETFKKLEKR